MPEPRKSFGAFDSIEGATESIDLDDPLLQELAETPAFAPVAPDTLGPYRVLNAVGRGGMGMVYRARHAETGVTVALKTVRVPNEKMLASIRREIHTLASMRHPGIVRILDEGVHEGLPWYTMELLEGTTLREAMGAARRSGQAQTEVGPLRRRYGMGWWTHALAGSRAAKVNRDFAPTVRSRLGGGLPSRAEGTSKNLTALLTLIRRLCAPLAYLHGEGLVHRDLKPDNVLVQPDGRPVLVDFGLASQHSRDLSRDVLQVEGSVMGTALYMSPEQIRGGLVDGRADLYALGCILYELVTGRPPFAADRMGELLTKHLQQPPERPSKLVSGVPEGLDELMLRLLAKNPEERLGYAEDVASALGRLGIADGQAISGPKPRPYLYRARFTGRATPMEVLERSLARAKAGEGGLVLVHGESGVGKTRLLLEFGQQVARQDGLVLSGECVERGGAPLQALRAPLHSLADRCRERGRSETERLFGGGARLLARYERSIQGLLDEKDPSQPESIPADQAQQQLYRVLARTFTALAQDPPLLLILDDLQWADELTIGFLESLLRSGQLERCGWLLIAAVRTEELSPELAKICESNGAQSLRLGRLREEALGAMVCDMLALDAPPVSFVRFLQRQSEGNPFFVAEYLRTAVSEGLLFRDEEGRWQVADQSEDLATEAVYEELPLPGSIQQLVGRRLGGLTDAGRQVVDAAVVVGREVAFPLVAWIAALPLAQMLEASAELLRRQVLEESTGGALRFVHDKLREVAYESLHEERRQELHRRAAEGIETLFAERIGDWEAMLGHHWEQASETEKARAYDLAGARRARDRYAFDEAERLYRAYLRLAPQPDAEALTARSELAMGVLESRGRFEDATEECERALAVSRELKGRPREGQILADLAKLYRIQGRMDDARDLFERALQALSSESLDPLSRSSPAQRQTEGTLLAEFGILHHLLGRFEDAEALYRRAMSIFSGSRGLADATPSARDQRGEGRTLGYLAILHHEQGRLDEAKALYEQALELRRSVGDRRGVGTILGNLANLLRVQGDLEQARELYEQALAVKREVDDKEGEGYNLGNLANLHNEQGRAEEALSHFEQALKIAREAGNRRLEGIVTGNLAGFQHDQGRPVEARALYEKALSISQELGDRPGEGILLCHMAGLERRAWGQLDAAEEHLIQAESILRDVNDLLHLVICLCQRGHVELARGVSGREWLERAVNLSGTLDLRSESELHTATNRLRHAQEAFDRGETETLFRGNALMDLPRELILWLRVTGQLTTPAMTEGNDSEPTSSQA